MYLLLSPALLPSALGSHSLYGLTSKTFSLFSSSPSVSSPTKSSMRSARGRWWGFPPQKQGKSAAAHDPSGGACQHSRLVATLDYIQSIPMTSPSLPLCFFYWEHAIMHNWIALLDTTFHIEQLQTVFFKWLIIWSNKFPPCRSTFQGKLGGSKQYLG